MADLIAEWSDFIITDKGLALRQKVIAERLNIEFTKAEIGEGVPSSPDEIWTMTALVSFAQVVGVKKSFVIDTTHHLSIFIENKNFTTDIMMREISVYARALDKDDKPVGGEVLYGYAYAIHGYDPIPPGSSQYRVWEIGANTGISRTSDIEVKYGDSVVYISREEFNQRFLPIEPYYDLVRIDHNLSGCPLVQLGMMQYGAGMSGAGEGPAGGTALETFPTKVIHHNFNSLTVRTIKPIVDLGAPTLHQVSPYWYTVTFEGDPLNSANIFLYPAPLPLSDTDIFKVSPKIGFKILGGMQ